MSEDIDEHDTEIVYREFDTTTDTPNTAVVGTVAKLDGLDTTELSPLYTTIDHVLDNLFSEPPAPEAQAEITFTYEGYRITIQQDGTGKFVKVT